MRLSRQCEREFPFEAIGVRVNASTGAILVVHHDADLYGADKSLLWSVRALVAGGLEPIVVVPTSGPLVDILRREGFEVHIGAVGKTSRSLGNPLAWLRFAADLLASFRFLDQAHGKRLPALEQQGAFYGARPGS